MTLPSALDIFASPKWVYSVDIPSSKKNDNSYQENKSTNPELLQLRCLCDYFQQQTCFSEFSQKAVIIAQIHFLLNLGKYVYKFYLIGIYSVNKSMQEI